jgi:hypothetical protein
MSSAAPATTLQPTGAAALAALRLPLVPRSKPACGPLDARIARTCRLARATAAGENDPLEHAAEALNLAALILSDCGAPELAKQLCRQQALCFATAGPYDTATAKLALQPVINIGRLLSLAADPAAHRYFQALFSAVAGRGEITIDGDPVSYVTLARSDNDHREIVQWLWQVLLADGTRALTRAGRWSAALEHITQHNGAGERLLDGRQVLILARAAEQDHEAALTLLAASSTPTAWEQPVAACLQALVLAMAGQLTAAAISAMSRAYEQPGLAGTHAVFRVRLGLCALSLATGTRHEPAIARQVIRAALDDGDAYAAHEVTRHHDCMSHATGAERLTLSGTVRKAGLGQGKPPAEQLDLLMDAARISEAAIRASLSARTRASG